MQISENVELSKIIILASSQDLKKKYKWAHAPQLSQYQSISLHKWDETDLLILIFEISSHIFAFNKNLKYTYIIFS